MMKESKWYKWEVLLILWMAYLLNQGDRQVFNTVLPAIRDALDLTDTSVGLIATIFNLFYAAMVPIGGWAGDRFSRKWVTTASIVFWSVATMFTGLATSFFWLVVLRSVATGGGEAMFGPANYSLLGQYHTDTRARAMSIHQTAYYVGVILAGWLAGAIADSLGWKYSFIIFGAAGVVWGVLMIFRLKDKKDDTVIAMAGAAGGETGASVARPGFLDGFKTVFTTPTALMLTIGFSCFIFVITGYMTWVPAYLQEEFGQSQAAAGFYVLHLRGRVCRSPDRRSGFGQACRAQPFSQNGSPRCRPHRRSRLPVLYGRQVLAVACVPDVRRMGILPCFL